MAIRRPESYRKFAGVWSSTWPGSAKAPMVQRDVADSDSYSSFIAVAWIIASVLPKSGETPVTTVFPLLWTWETEDLGVRMRRQRRTREGRELG